MSTALERINRIAIPDDSGWLEEAEKQVKNFMNEKDLERLEAMTPCSDGLIWAMNQPDLKTAWEKCFYPEWLMWFAMELEVDRRELTRAVAYCLLTEERRYRHASLHAISTAIQYANGEAEYGSLLLDIRTAQSQLEPHAILLDCLRVGNYDQVYKLYRTAYHRDIMVDIIRDHLTKEILKKL